MTANGFLERKQASPLGFGTVLLLHGAVIAAVVMVKGPGWEREPVTNTHRPRLHLPTQSLCRTGTFAPRRRAASSPRRRR
jgi:hypothetical protein